MIMTVATGIVALISKEGGRVCIYRPDSKAVTKSYIDLQKAFCLIVVSRTKVAKWLVVVDKKLPSSHAEFQHSKVRFLVH
jgi:tRNA A58 N-methylase Trm61